jgi:hypothetical protein
LGGVTARQRVEKLASAVASRAPQHRLRGRLPAAAPGRARGRGRGGRSPARPGRVHMCVHAPGLTCEEGAGIQGVPQAALRVGAGGRMAGGCV